MMTRGVLQIPTRRFGRTDLRVSEFGLGCARIGGVFKTNPEGFVTLLSRAFDAGITFFDTADIYSQGESEKLLGRAFRGRRDRVVLASKAGYVLPSQRRFANWAKPVLRPALRLLKLSRDRVPAAVRGTLTQDFSPAHLVRAVEGSLRRLNTDYLDLLQLHSPPASVIRAGAWLAALESLRQDGKIRYYGVSCDTVDAAEAVLQHARVSSLQLPLNLLDRSTAAIPPRAGQLGIAVIARECLANGLLVRPASEAQPDSRECDAEAAVRMARVRRYRDLARASGCTLPQLALQFAADVEGVSAALIGVSRTEQLESLLTAGLRPEGNRSASVPDLA